MTSIAAVDGPTSPLVVSTMPLDLDSGVALSTLLPDADPVTWLRRGGVQPVDAGHPQPRGRADPQRGPGG